MTTPVFAESTFKTTFARGAWNESEWTLVKSGRWTHQGKWVQEDDHITNEVPSGLSPQQLQSQNPDTTYVSMIANQKVSGDATIAATTSFDYRMAPGIIIAAEPAQTPLGPEYRDHFEIILYDKGINIWRHYFEDGQQKWVKRAFITADFKPDVRYTMTAKTQFTKKGPQITVQVGDLVFGYHEPFLTTEYRVGIVACEGRNRFYDFALTTR